MVQKLQSYKHVNILVLSGLHTKTQKFISTCCLIFGALPFSVGRVGYDLISLQPMPPRIRIDIRIKPTLDVNIRISCHSQDILRFNSEPSTGYKYRDQIIIVVMSISDTNGQELCISFQVTKLKRMKMVMFPSINKANMKEFYVILS